MVIPHGSVFTGIGLLDYGLCLAGLGEPEWVCEQDEWRRERILARRFPGAVRYNDVRAVGAGCEPVELVAGGFPCKGASTLGKRNGFDHAETVLWREMARAIGELRPRYVLVENVANILALNGGVIWAEVLGDLAALGFNVVWDCIPAAAVGAPHLRDRVLAIATDATSQPQRTPDDQAHAKSGGGRARQVPGERDPGAAPDPDGVSGRLQPVAERRCDDQAAARDAGQAAADSGARGRQGIAAVDGAQSPGLAADVERLGIPVEWGEYGPAVRRWEAIHGDAPEPLCAFRGVDARAAAGVERSRLSALGDGVQVQVGVLAGAYILDRERERLARELVPENDGKAA